MLIAVLGPAAGKVAMIALLMLQITSASGTYPVQTTPAFFQVLHPLLPMTYAVQGLRDLVTGYAGRSAVGRDRLSRRRPAGLAGRHRLEGRPDADLDRRPPSPCVVHLSTRAI